MVKKITGILFGVLLGQTAGILWAAFGATSTFAKVELGPIEAGRVLHISSVARPLTVTNTGDIPVTLTLRLLRPAKTEVDKGFDPVPSVVWAVLEKNKFVLAPGESGTTDVILKPSLEEKYRGKHYQLNIMSRIVSTGGNVRIVLAHKVQFTVAQQSLVSERAVAEASKLKVHPSIVEVKNVDLGRLSVDPLRSLNVQNADRKRHRYRIRFYNPEASAEFEDRFSPVTPPPTPTGTDGFVLGAGQQKALNSANGMKVVFDGLLPRNWVSVGIEEFELDAGEKRAFPIKLYLPHYDALKNKAFTPLIRVTQIDGDFPSSLIPVYLTTSDLSYDDPPLPEFQKPIYADVRATIAE
jgi:hypothetical protein